MKREYYLNNIDYIKSIDEDLGDIIELEVQRQNCNLELIASENVASYGVMAACGSIFTNKYAEGYPEKRYYGGCQNMDKAEKLAIDRACRLFGAEHANVQPHSGSQANLAVYFALLEPGDTVLGMDLTQGGHLTHGSKVNISGKYFNFVPYGVDPKTQLLDYQEILKLARETKPKLIVCGASAYSRTIDFKKFREIADETNAYLMVDMAHIAGLVAAGVHPNPTVYADVVTTTTHKTLRGPRGGMILCKKELAKSIDKAIFPGIQGGPLMHVVAAKAVCLKEAMSNEFKEYAKQIIKNAKALARTLINNGIRLVSGGTDNHLMLIDLREKNMTGKDLEAYLEQVNITVNKNTVPNDPLGTFTTSGIRIGTAAVTTRGLLETDMVTIGECIAMIIKDFKKNKDYVKETVANICRKYPIKL